MEEQLEQQQQDFGDNPTAVRQTDHYKVEYIQEFVQKWDDLIDWDAREAGEDGFFIEELKKRGVKRILDVAAGTGYHSVKLLKAGFDVTCVDGSAEMLAKAFENGRKHGFILRTIQADWRMLKRDVHEQYDAVICLGNSFTHLFKENDRRKSLAEFYSVLKHDGVLIIDHRNYDVIIDKGYQSKHSFYYAGQNIKAMPEHVDDGLCRFRYEFPDNSVFHLNLFPLRKAYMERLLTEVGFQQITTFADFQGTNMVEDPDFLVHVAEKKYTEPI